MKHRKLFVSGITHYHFVGWFIYYCKVAIPSEHLNIKNYGFHHLFGKWYLFAKSKYVYRMLSKKKKKKAGKIYRKDLNLWEEKTWYGYKYMLFGKPDERTLFKK